MSKAHKSLRRLLEQAERCWARTGKPNASIVFSQASNPDYVGLSTFAEKQAYHAVLLHAEHLGALTIEWDVAAGHQNQVARVRLKDGDSLATLLEIVPRWRSMEEARRLCEPLMSRFPIVDAVLNAWREGRKPRGLQPSEAPLLADAAQAIDYCHRHVQHDMTVRRLSTRLGFDSKHLESLVPALDLLKATRLDDPPREREELFAELGIMKHPLPVLVAGSAVLRLIDSATIGIPAPYVGLGPDSILTVELQSSCRHVLSVENLTTFHELAEKRCRDVLLIYSNGMPSPSWMRFYDRMLAVLPSTCRLMHWGDIDGGGYRIAAHISALCRSRGKHLNLHMMNPRLHPEELSWRPLETQEQTYMERLAREAGWINESKGILERPLAYEQEALDLEFPGTNAGWS
jgi:hypothetical protein